MNPTPCPTCGFANPAGAATCSACGTPLPRQVTPSHVLPPGTRLNGGLYTVGKVLGQGGFGITYLGSDTRRSEAVAVKELFPAGSMRHGREVHPGGEWTEAAFQEALQKFELEGQTLARFHHPNIVGVRAVFPENRTAYLVMEYLKGQDLDQLLVKRGGPLPEREAVGYVLQVAQALVVVHGAGLLHRDIKPGNILVEGQRAVLVDFGSAREFAAERTHRMTALLTPGYAPLEQYSQHARFGAFTDLYALSATLYHLLTGQVPVASLDRIQGVDLPAVRKRNPQVSEPTEHAVMRGLEMQVDRRPQSAREFMELLRHVAPQPEPRPARPARAPRPTPQPAARPAPRSRQPASPVPVLAGTLRGHSNWVHGVRFSPRGDMLASVGQDNTLILWDAATGRPRFTVGTGTGPLLGLGGALFAVAYTPHGNTLATGGNDDIIRLWDTHTGGVFREMPGQSGNVNGLAFSPRDRILAAACQLNHVELWDAGSGELLARLFGFGWSFVSVAFAPDGETLAAGGEDGNVVVWNARTGEGIATLKGHGGGVRAVGYSPDGDLIATGSDDYTVHVWNRWSGDLEQTLDRHAGGVRAVSFSPDSRLLATGGDDTDIGLWAMPEGRLLTPLRGHTATVTSLSFAPDGRSLASASMDGTVRLWQIR